MILSDSVSQETMFEQKDHTGKIFIAKGDHFTHSSGDGELRRKSRHTISGIKGDHMLDEKLMSNIFSSVDVTVVTGQLWTQ